MTMNIDPVPTPAMPPNAGRANHSSETLIIKPSRGSLVSTLRELWRYRQLLWFLVWRDLRVRYAQTVIGVGWAVIQPLVLMAIFSIFLGRLIDMPSNGLPYPLFVLAGLVIWNLTANSLVGASNSLVNAANLVSKIYFPRVLLPLSSLGISAIDFAVGSVLLLIATLYFGFPLEGDVVWIVLALAITIATVIGLGLWLAALNVRYRDVRYAVPFMVQVWLWCSPVAYPSSVVPPEFRLAYSLNPLVTAIDGFRWGLFGTGTAPGPGAIVSIAVAFGLVIAGATYFGRVERSFADVI